MRPHHATADGTVRSAAVNGATHAPVVRDALRTPTGAGRASAESRYACRQPDKNDGAAIWELVRKSGALDLNSAYSYLMMSEYFAETSRVAYRGRRLAGFVAGFTPPRKPDTLFVWQIGIDPREQGRGLGKHLLRNLLATPSCGHLRHLEATVTPSNRASERLFRGIAAHFNVPCRIEPVFAEHDFPGEGHEAERRFRIGPIPTVGRAGARA
jgi:L-2,4-diaminobutyric acid acetyltransferase